MTALLLLLALVAQDDDLKSVTILKQDRAAYVPALKAFKDAETLLATDAAAAIEKCSGIIDDKNLKDANREVKIRLQNSDGSYGDWVTFVPFQLRGRARLARATALGKTARDEAVKLARDAVADFEESIKRGANSGKAHLAEANKLLSTLAAADDPRVAEARTIMDELRGSKLGPDAMLKRLAEVEAKIKDTPFESEFKLLRESAERKKSEERRLALEKSIQQLRDFADTKPDPDELIKRCDALAETMKGSPLEGQWKMIRDGAVADRVDRLRTAWSTACDEGRFRSALKIMMAGDFLTDDAKNAFRERTAERCNRYVDAALLKFQRALRDTLEDAVVQLPKCDFDATFPLPDAAELIATSPSLDWCRATRTLLEKLREPAKADLLPALKSLSDAAASAPDAKYGAPLDAFALDLARRRLDTLTDNVTAAAADARMRRRREAEQIVAVLPRAKLSAYLDRFPIDVARIDELAAALSDPKEVCGDSPMAALDRIEAELRRIRGEAARLSVESRRRLGTVLIVVASTRSLLAGRSSAETTKLDEVREAGRLAWDAGGIDAEILKKFSPKIAAIADAVKP